MASARTTIVALAAFTGAGNSLDVDVTTGTMMAIEVDITTGSGTITDFDLWMEGSNDDGLTWFRLLASTIDANGTDVTTPRSNIVNNKATTTAERYGAVYPYVPTRKVRARWTLTGTSPSLTFAVYLGVK